MTVPGVNGLSATQAGNAAHLLLKEKNAANAVSAPEPVPTSAFGASGRLVVAKRNVLLALLMRLIVVIAVPRQGNAWITVLGVLGLSAKEVGYVVR
jgi:hypothetical protein